MAEDLANGVFLGGATVEIKGDVSDVEQKVSSVRQLVERLEARPVEVRMRLVMVDGDNRRITGAGAGGIAGEREQRIVARLDTGPAERGFRDLMVRLQSQANNLVIVPRVAGVTQTGIQGGGGGFPPAPGGMIAGGTNAGTPYYTFGSWNAATQRNTALSYNPATNEFFNSANGTAMAGVGWPMPPGGQNQPGNNPGARRGGMAMMGRIVAGLAIREGVQVLATARDSARDMVMAGDDPSAQFKAIMKAQDTGVIGTLMSVATDPTGSRAAGAELVMKSAEDQDRVAQSMYDSKQGAIVSREEHAVIMAKGEFNKRVAEADKNYNTSSHQLVTEKNKALEPALKAKQDAYALADADNSMGWKGNVASLMVGGPLGEAGANVAYSYLGNKSRDAKRRAADDEYARQTAPIEADFAGQQKDLDDERDRAKVLAGRDKAAALRTLGSENRQLTLGIEATRMIAAGDSAGALGKRREGERYTLSTSIDTEIDHEEDPDRQKQMRANKDLKLAAFDEETTQQMAKATADETARKATITSTNRNSYLTDKAIGAATDRDSMSAYAYQRQQEKNDAITKSQIEINDPKNADIKAGLQQQFTARFGTKNAQGQYSGGTEDEQTKSHLKLMHDQEQAANTQLVARASADRLRIAHQTFDAEMKLLKAEGEAKVLVASAGTKENVIAANKADQDALTAKHDEKIAAALNEVNSTQKLTRQIIERNFDGAAITKFDMETDSMIAGTDDEEVRGNIRKKRGFEKDALVAGQDFEHKITGEDLDARATVADQRVAGQDKAASFTARIRDEVKDLELAQPKDQEKTKLVVGKELEAMKHELTGYHGGGIGAGTNDWGVAGEKILAGRIEGQKEKGILEEINAAERQAGLDPTTGKVATAPKWDNAHTNAWNKARGAVKPLGKNVQGPPSPGNLKAAVNPNLQGPALPANMRGKLVAKSPASNIVAKATNPRDRLVQTIQDDELNRLAAFGNPDHYDQLTAKMHGDDAKLVAYDKAHPAFHYQAASGNKVLQAAAAPESGGKVIGAHSATDAMHPSAGGSGGQLGELLKEVRNAVKLLSAFTHHATTSPAVARGL